jgi:signal peptidase
MTAHRSIPIYSFSQILTLCWLRDHCHGTLWYNFSAQVSQVHLLQNDFPQLKYALLGGLGLLALVQRE